MGHPRLELMDWKRRVHAMYAAVRGAGGAPAACAAFRGERDELFAEHPASPLPAAERARFAGVPYFPHRPDMRVEATLDPDPEGAELVIPTSTGEPTTFTRIGFVRPTLAGAAVSLAVYWLEGYGGGLFLPFRDTLARRGDLRRRPLPAGHREGGRPRHQRRRGAPGARLQLRLQPVVRLRPALELPPGAAREPARGRRSRPASGWHRGPERRPRPRGHRVAASRPRTEGEGDRCSARSGAPPRDDHRASSRCSWR